MTPRFLKLGLMISAGALQFGPGAFADETAITFYNAPQTTQYNSSPYREGFALVQHNRDFQFNSGRTTIIWPDVSSAIDPATVTFKAKNADIIEQNFDFDLLTPAKLLEKSVGETVYIVRINPATGQEEQKEAKILSVNQGAVIEVDGKIEVLRDDNLPTRVIFDDVPENLRARPTLSVDVNSTRAGQRDAQLTYISNGLGWRGDYVAVFDQKTGKMNLQGWATIKNTTSTTFENAKLSLAAGNVSVSSSQENWHTWWQRRQNELSNRSRVNGGSEATGEERIGDAYIYTLPFETTVASQQTKQISIIDAENVTAERIYEHQSGWYRSINAPVNADVKIAFSNTRKSGLAAALPAGIFRVYSRDESGRAQFIGEDAIPNSPGGSQLGVRIGSAFDIMVQQTLVKNARVDKNREYEMRFVITNAKAEPATVRIRQARQHWPRTAEVIKETHPHSLSPSGGHVWDIQVPAEGEATLEFTISHDDD